MDKIVRRVRQVERNVLRRALRKEKDAKLEGILNARNGKKSVGREVTLSIRDSIKARHEDWELGPLAPRRDAPWVQDDRDSKNQLAWGTVSMDRATLMRLDMSKTELEARCAWAGGQEHLCIMPGDRVVVVEGALKGKIDKISAINLETGVVRLQDMRWNITLPEGLANKQGLQDTAAIPARLPISSIRLVHPIRDEEAGVTRDVIIKKLQPIKITPDRATRTVTWSRMVPGLNVTIPWPEMEKPEEPEVACDTKRIDLEQRTYIPTLLKPPMPETLIDELRNRYSKFRTRHTEEYIRKKEAEQAAKKEARRKEKKMWTPVQEFNRLQRAMRRSRGQPELTEEMLAKIGEVMAKNINTTKMVKPSIPEIPAEVKGKAGKVTTPS